MSAKLDVAVHEAAHAVFALDEDIGLGDSIDMSLRGGFCHFAKDITERAAADPSLWAPKLIKALLAGQIAQEMHVRAQGFSILDGDREAWADDNRRCLEIAKGGLRLDEESALVEIDLLRGLVTERLRHPQIWAAVQLVAKELNRKGSLTGAEAEALFNRAMSEDRR